MPRSRVATALPRASHLPLLPPFLRRHSKRTARETKTTVRERHIARQNLRKIGTRSRRIRHAGHTDKVIKLIFFFAARRVALKSVAVIAGLRLAEATVVSLATCLAWLDFFFGGRALARSFRGGDVPLVVLYAHLQTGRPSFQSPNPLSVGTINRPLLVTWTLGGGGEHGFCRGRYLPNMDNELGARGPAVPGSGLPGTAA